MVQLLRQTVWRVLKTLKPELPYDPQSHFCIFTQKSREENPKDVFASHVHGSITHRVTERVENNLNVHQQISQ